MKVFVEEQKFSRWIILAIMLIPLIAGIASLFIEDKESLGLNQEGVLGLTFTFSIVALVLLFILSIQLKTKIDEQGIYYQFFPIHFSQKFISWGDLKSCEVIKYNSLTQYGGYGYRISFFKNKGTAINIGGDHGIQLVMKSGKRLLIGTQKQEDAKTVLQAYKSKYTLNEK